MDSRRARLDCNLVLARRDGDVCQLVRELGAVAEAHMLGDHPALLEAVCACRDLSLDAHVLVLDRPARAQRNARDHPRE